MPKEPELSIILKTDELRVLIVGGGKVALQKFRALPPGIAVRLVAPLILPALKRAPIRRSERRYRPSDLNGAELIFAATANPALNASIADSAKALGLWVSVADQPALGNFTLPAVSKHGLLRVSVSSSGASPAVSKALRQWLDARLKGSKLLALTRSLQKQRAAMKKDPRLKAKILRPLQSPKDFARLLNA
jgi:siroheme synthase-like protein